MERDFKLKNSANIIEIITFLNILAMKIESMNVIISKMDKQNKIAERKNRNRNLIFYGIPDYANEENDIWRTVIEIINSKLNLENFNFHHIQEIKRLGKFKNNSCRPVLVKLGNKLDSEAILSKSNLLRGTSIWINRDYSMEERQERNNLMPYLLAAKKNGMNSKIRGTKLIINNEVFNLNQCKEKFRNNLLAEDEANISQHSISSDKNNTHRRCENIEPGSSRMEVETTRIQQLNIAEKEISPSCDKSIEPGSLKKDVENLSTAVEDLSKTTVKFVNSKTDIVNNPTVNIGREYIQPNSRTTNRREAFKINPFAAQSIFFDKRRKFSSSEFSNRNNMDPSVNSSHRRFGEEQRNINTSMNGNNNHRFLHNYDLRSNRRYPPSFRFQ